MKVLTASDMASSIVDNPGNRAIKFVSSTTKRLAEIVAVISVSALCGIIGAILLSS